MQFDKDLNSNKAELFLKVRDFITKNIEKHGSQVREKYSDNITTIYSKEFCSGFCYIKTKDDYIRIGWFKGSFIDDEPNLLFGQGKMIRGQKVYKLDKTQKDAIKYYVNQSQILLSEKEEMHELKKAFNVNSKIKPL